MEQKEIGNSQENRAIAGSENWIKTYLSRTGSKIMSVGMICIVFTMLSGCDVLMKVADDYAKQGVLSKEDAVAGLKEALSTATVNSITGLKKENGFYMDNLVKVQFPPEINSVAKTLTDMGMSSVVESFVKKLNEGSEKAVTKALPIFKTSIQNMSFNDAMGVLLGDNVAATNYFKQTTRTELYTAFNPVIKTVLDEYGISSSYASLMKSYNAIPFVKKVNADLVDYVTNKTLDGMFSKIAIEETKIRTDINARTTATLQKVFGYADLKK